MGKILTWGCKVKSRGVPKIWPISETGRANILKFLGIFHVSKHLIRALVKSQNVFHCSSDHRLIEYFSRHDASGKVQ